MPKMPHDTRLAKAVQTLKFELEQGREWPDATWTICRQWDVGYDELAQAYDNQSQDRTQ